jgi:hypothetical protein
MSDIIYIVEYAEPGKELVSIIAKPTSAMRLVRRLMKLGIAHFYDRMDTKLMTAREIEDLIDGLEVRHRIALAAEDMAGEA